MLIGRVFAASFVLKFVAPSGLQVVDADIDTHGLAGCRFRCPRLAPGGHSAFALRNHNDFLAARPNEPLR